MIKLAQPYLLSSVRFFLWEGADEGRCYSYFVAVSTNKNDWVMIADKTTSWERSWQDIRFAKPLPVVYIKIKGTRTSIGNERLFQCAHFECPSTVELSEKQM